jgi:hypothetical protein
MDEQEMPMDDDTGEWARELELEQQYFEEVNNNGVKSN